MTRRRLIEIRLQVYLVPFGDFDLVIARNLKLSRPNLFSYSISSRDNSNSICDLTIFIYRSKIIELFDIDELRRLLC